jgi:hypothetical protein
VVTFLPYLESALGEDLTLFRECEGLGRRIVGFVEWCFSFKVAVTTTAIIITSDTTTATAATITATSTTTDDGDEYFQTRLQKVIS